MKFYFKITSSLLQAIQSDLSRRHNFAFERVGFIACKVGRVGDKGLVLLAYDYFPVHNEHYLKDFSVGATIGPDAIRRMMQLAYDQPISVVHVHEHVHNGKPSFSGIDRREMARLIPDFWHVRPNLPHAAIVMSKDSICGYVWDSHSKNSVEIADFTIVGTPMKFIRN
jgi:proteasome lid subunit RPN8/RPN11